jgi:hypothetical protein
MKTYDTDSLTEREMEDIILADHKPFLDQMEKENAIEEGTYAYNLKELLALDLNVNNLLDPILPAVGLTWIQGLPDGGKSTFARELSVRTVLGCPSFLSYKLNPKHKRALVVLTEESLGRARESLAKQWFSVVAERVRERKQEQHQTGVELPAWDYVGAMQNIEVLPAHSLSNEQTIQCIEDRLSKKGYDLVVIDALADVLEKLDGNNNHQIRGGLKPFFALAEKYECLLLFIGHVNKAGYDRPPSQRDLQGGAAFAQKARLILDFRPDLKEDGMKYLSIVKGNNVDDSLKKDSMVLHWSRETFLLSYEGEKVPRDTVGVNNPGGREKTEIDWAKFIKPNEMITYPELKRRMEGQTPLSDRRLRDRAREELNKVGDKFGLKIRDADFGDKPDVDSITPKMYE